MVVRCTPHDVQGQRLHRFGYARSRRPVWGLAQLMRPARAAPGVPFVSAAMLAPERLQQQSSRHSDPVGSCQPPFRIANTNIRTVPGACQGVTRLRDTSRKTSRAVVDAAPPLDEPIQWLGICLVLCRVTHHTRPFAACSFVGLRRVGRAPDDRGERPSRADASSPCNRSARRARGISRPSAAHQITRAHTVPRIGIPCGFRRRPQGLPPITGASWITAPFPYSRAPTHLTSVLVRREAPLRSLSGSALSRAIAPHQARRTAIIEAWSVANVIGNGACVSLWYTFPA